MNLRIASGARAAPALILAALAAGAVATSAPAAPGRASDCFGESGFDVFGTKNDDVLVGTPGPDRIYGGRGHDRGGERNQGCEQP